MWSYGFISQNFRKNNVKFSSNIHLLFLASSWLYVQVERRLACCFHLMYFQLAVRKEMIVSDNFLPCPVCVMCIVCCVQWSNWAELLTSICCIVSRSGQVSVAQPSYSTVRNSRLTEKSGICIECIHSDCCHCRGFIRTQRSRRLLWWVGWIVDIGYFFDGIQCSRLHF